MNLSKSAPRAAAILAAAAFLSLPAVSRTQVTTTETTRPKGITKEVTIDTAQVVYASGDDAVLKTPDGRLRLFELQPGTSLFIDGKESTAADLTPGMTISHVQVHGHQESEVTTVTQINGRILATHGQWLTLRLEDGTSKRYRVPPHATFTVDGRPAQFNDLRSGMRISATAVRTERLDTHTAGAAKVVHTPPQTGTLLIEES